MRLWLGNPWAVEAYDDPTTGTQCWRAAPGERVIEAFYPEEVPEDHPDAPWTPSTVAASIIGQLSYHMLPDRTPPWIETDNELLTQILCDHFKLDPKKARRPKTWGDGSWLAKNGAQ